MINFAWYILTDKQVNLTRNIFFFSFSSTTYPVKGCRERSLIQLALGSRWSTPWTNWQFIAESHIERKTIILDHVDAYGLQLNYITSFLVVEGIQWTRKELKKAFRCHILKSQVLRILSSGVLVVWQQHWSLCHPAAWGNTE